jgi:beta-glucoside operon transcriptional antiterminator
MFVEKVINNNIVTSFDHKAREIIVMGKGLGFGKKNGDLIDQSQIEKTFLLKNQKQSDQFMSLIEAIPLEHVQTSTEIIEYAKQELQKPLSENIYVALTDHLNFAIERYQKNIPIQNALLWEIKKFYRKEYEIGKAALGIIEERLGIILSNDEAGFIALHLVNADMGNNMNQSMTVMKMIQDILNIIKYFYQMELDEESMDYERLVTHLKFFIQRVYSGHSYERDDKEFLEMMIKQYPKAYACCKKIRDYINQKLNYEFQDEEMVYLIVHMKRITRGLEE